MKNVNQWLEINLVDPINKLPLKKKNNYFLLRTGDIYPIINNIPIMLPLNKKLNHISAYNSLDFIKDLKKNNFKNDEYFINTTGLSKFEKKMILEKLNNLRGLKNNKKNELKKCLAIVSGFIAATNGIAYKSSLGNLTNLPIPIIPEKIFENLTQPILDIGCNWGRWSIACSNKKNIIIGIDPCLSAVNVASKLAKNLNINFIGIVGDARFLPFKTNSISSVISYSVIQHFSRKDVNITIKEINRILKPKGFSAVQMPNKIGLRCFYHQILRGFRDGKNFEVRYWSLKELTKIFSYIGRVKIITDCYLGLGLQDTDFKFMSISGKIALAISKFFKKIPYINSGKILFADSVWVLSEKKN